MKRWLKIIITTPPQLVDAITDFLVGVMDGGVEAGIDESLEWKTLNVYLEQENPTDQDMEESVNRVRAYLAELATIFGTEKPHLESEEIEEEDWGANWKKYFTPLAVTARCVIVPTWENYSAKSGETCIVMDPGMAFGTGHHATTALALALVEEELPQLNRPAKVLDVGTGTGVLGIGAALLGASSVLAIDNDPIAVETAGENAVLNDVAHCMRASGQPLGEIEAKFELVIANIVHDVLVAMADDLHRVTEPDGLLILSGILHGEQVDSITAVFEEKGFRLKRQRDRDEWSALLFECIGEG